MVTNQIDREITMTHEEKAKAYDEAFERAKKLATDLPNGRNDRLYHVDDLEYIFPELKESEDERIRKAIIEGLREMKNSFHTVSSIKIDDAIAWLEKQGEKADIANKEYWRGYREGKQEILDKYAELKKQGEKKPSDKAEPKFHEGDWVFIEEGKEYKGPFQIKTVDSFGYSFDEYYTIPFMYEDILSKWTIQDAKDGDVLTYNDSKNNVWICIFKEYANERVYDYCTLDKESFWERGNWNYLASFSYTPSTKEQRDKLEKAMADAGYTFDFEKKELKKIENEIEIPFGAKDSELQEDIYYIPKGFYAKIDDNKVIIKKGEQKPAWSEEDELILKHVIANIESIKEEVIYCKPWLNKQIDWLKSLKDRVQPKAEWSEDDERNASYIVAALDCYYRLREERNNTNGQEDLDKARNWLHNKLKSFRTLGNLDG